MNRGIEQDQGVAATPPGLRPFGVEPATQSQAEPLVPNAVQWFCERGDFWGTINQLCLCAKCGKSEMKRRDEPRHYAGVFTPRLHMICDDCFASLPEGENPSPTASDSDGKDAK